MSNRIARTLTVPEGVAGERIDSALTRVLGLSRTAVVKLLEDGDITTGGKPMPKSDRVSAGQVIEVLMPEPINSDPIPLTPIDGLSIIYDDSDIVVIDKPVGCAAHPSPGWTGPTVVGALLAVGYSISTSGPAERQGIVHRLDVGTSGLMIVAKSRIQTNQATPKSVRHMRTVSAVLPSACTACRELREEIPEGVLCQ